LSLLAELKRRNVIRAVLVWLALSWLMVAMASMLFPALGLPITAVRFLIYGLLAACVPVIVLAWMCLFMDPDASARPDAGPPAAPTPRIGQRLDQLIVILVLAALSLSLLRQFIVAHGPAPDAAPARQTPAAVSPRPVDPHSIALLPFTNQSPDADDAYFADGLSDELINVLARIRGLKVTSRSSSFMFRGSDAGSREIGAQLGVAHLVEGSVRRQGEDVRISVQLIDARSDQHLWSQTFDRRLVDIFRVQEEISQAIADALAVSLGVRKVEVTQLTADLDAYELYLRGRQLFALRGANLEAARSLLAQAVERDPRFAQAWATLAGIDYVLPSYSAEFSQATSARAREAAERALTLAPELADALAVRARLAADEGDRLASLVLFKRALAADPNSANTWMWKGLTLLEAGHVKRARAAFSSAQRLDPLSGIHFGWMGAAELIEGEVELAREHLERAHALGWRGPASAWLLKLALGEGDAEGAAKRYADWLRDDGRIGAEQRAIHEALAPALIDPGMRDAARERLAQAIVEWPEYDWASLHLFLGLTEEAMAEALRDKPASGQILLMMVWAPVDQPFREHPGFLEIAERSGLLAFWDAEGEADGCRRIEAPELRLACER